MRETKLKVFHFPQNNSYVPSIRVTGKWLAEEGFPYGTRVKLIATVGKIIITRQEQDELSSEERDKHGDNERDKAAD